MIRTNYVKLTKIKGVAYREKRAVGDCAIVVLKYGEPQPGIAGISKKTGEAIPTQNTNTKKYPIEVFQEGIELTAGMPYHRQGKVILDQIDFDDKEIIDEPVEVDLPEAEYEKIVSHYTDKNGKLSYDLINKEMIKFLNSSQVVATMISDPASDQVIRNYIVGVKFRDITGNRDLTNREVLKIVEMLDEVYPDGIFKDFNKEIRKKLSESKQSRR